MADARRLLTITVLGSTQTLAWASSYYLPAILADDIARDTGTSTTWLYAAFSVSLIISALLGPRAGRLIDRGSGNAVLAASNLLFAGGLVPAVRRAIPARPPTRLGRPGHRHGHWPL